MGRGIYVIKRGGEDKCLGVVFMAGSAVESSPRGGVLGRSELFGKSEAVSRKEWFDTEWGIKRI